MSISRFMFTATPASTSPDFLVTKNTPTVCACRLRRATKRLSSISETNCVYSARSRTKGSLYGILAPHSRCRYGPTDSSHSRDLLHEHRRSRFRPGGTLARSGTSMPTCGQDTSPPPWYLVAAVGSAVQPDWKPQSSRKAPAGVMPGSGRPRSAQALKLAP